MLFIYFILATYIFEEGPWPAPITEQLGGRLWTQHCLIHSDTMQRLRGCLCGTSQTHLLAKKISITQSAGIRWFRRRLYKYPTMRSGCNPRGDRAKTIDNL